MDFFKNKARSLNSTGHASYDFFEKKKEHHKSFIVKFKKKMYYQIFMNLNIKILMNIKVEKEKYFYQSFNYRY